MSPSRRRALGLGAAVLVLALLSLRVARQSQQAAPPSPLPAIDNPGPQGLEAAFRLLAAQGGALVLDAPFDAVPPQARVLVTALPHARPVEEREQRAVLAWVEAGGTLVVLGNHERGLGGALAGVLDPPFSALHVDRDANLADLGRGMKALLDAATRPEPSEELRALPALPDPLLAGVQALPVGAGRGFEPQAGAAVPLVVLGGTAQLLALPHGKGRILAFAGPDPFTNARLDRGSNLQLLENLGAEGPVAFDEWHHRPEAAAGARVLLRAFGPALLALLLLAMAAALAHGRRLGPPRAPPGELGVTTRASALQLGRLYQRAGAAPWLREALQAEVRAALRRRTTLPPGASDEALVRGLERVAPEEVTHARALLARLSARGPLAPGAYLALAREAAALAQGRGRLLTAPGVDPILDPPAPSRLHPDLHG